MTGWAEYWGMVLATAIVAGPVRWFLGRALFTVRIDGTDGREEDPSEAEDASLDEMAELGSDEELAALTALAQLDLEAAAAYDVAAATITDETAREALTAFRDDHLRHVEDLNRLATARGGAGVEAKLPGTSTVLASLARTAAAIGDDVVIMALLANEQLTNRSYEVGLEVAWDDEVQAVLERNAADEQRHLQWLADVEDQLWGRGGEADVETATPAT